MSARYLDQDEIPVLNRLLDDFKEDKSLAVMLFVGLLIRDGLSDIDHAITNNISADHSESIEMVANAIEKLAEARHG